MMSSKLLYIEDLQELFTDVQTRRIFADQKVFTDCLPKFPAADIVSKYRETKDKPGFDLLHFIEANFDLPVHELFEAEQHAANPTEHIHLLWDKLTRKTADEYSSLIALPDRFVVPGGRFREFFYWDSYFTMLGLQVSGRTDLMESMVVNFAFLIDEFGFIPNGNRSYFLSRSQPPFFSLMIDLLAEEKGDEIYVRYLPQLKAEYAFWMNGAEGLTAAGEAHEHTVRLTGGEILNRFWDKQDNPRPEGYYEDLEIHAHTGGDQHTLFRNIRAACTSGWDFSGRWFADGKHIGTIRTTDLIPVDLNCLLWHLESVLSKAAALAGKADEAAFFEEKAEQRQKAIQRYLWSPRLETFLDYDFKNQKSSTALSMAMVFPLFFKLSTPNQANQVLGLLEKEFLKAGGLLTSPVVTGQQWDAPNGWAPLQWIGYKAAQNYGASALASKIAQSWVGTVDRVFEKTGKIMEKYNVVDTSLDAGGGEYPNQNGFGWTNGVYLKMKNDEHK